LNDRQYRIALNLLLNEASTALSAAEITAGLLNGLASILAINSVQTGTDPEKLLEVYRHELDELVVKYLKEYA
jgi:hypothetical protein